MLSHEEQSGASPERLNRAGEDYLKAILILQRRNGSVRSLDIVRLLGVSKPSVSVAVKLLREGGFQVNFRLLGYIFHIQHHT